MNKKMPRAPGATAILTLKPMPKQKHKPRRITILEDANFDWLPPQMDNFVLYWEQGYGLPAIAGMMKRPQVDVLLLQVQMELWDRIQPRKGGVMGWRTG
jgi:hypothetical protein